MEEEDSQISEVQKGEAMTIGDKVFTKKAMTYGGKDLDVRQVFELKGLKWDDTLLRHERVVPVPEEEELHECGECGAVFMDIPSRTVHGNKRHR